MSSQSTGRIAGVRGSYPVHALTHFSGEVSPPPQPAGPERPVRALVRTNYWR